MNPNPKSPDMPDEATLTLEDLVAEARRIARSLLAGEDRHEMRLLSATEVAHSVFRQMWTNPEQLEQLRHSPGKMRVYLKVAIRNKLASYVRETDAQKCPKIDHAHNLHDHTIDDLIGKGLLTLARERPSAAADLAAALASLEKAYPRAAKVVDSRYVLGLTIEETARDLGISPKTVKRDSAKALSLLRKHLADRQAGDTDD